MTKIHVNLKLQLTGKPEKKTKKLILNINKH